MALSKILEKKWTYILYKIDGVHVLSVICGGVGLFEINIKLSNEVGQKAAQDIIFLEDLVAEISSDPKKYSPQSVVIFD